MRDKSPIPEEGLKPAGKIWRKSVRDRGNSRWVIRARAHRIIVRLNEVRARPTVWAHQGHTNSGADEGAHHISLPVYLSTLSSWRVASALPFHV